MQYNIFVIGCGATGSNLITSLAQYAINQRKINEIILIDGDFVEEKNYRNQKFTKKDLSKNKAQVLSTRYARLNIKISCMDKYLKNSKDLIEVMSEFDSEEYLNIIVSCVDNNNARIILNDVFYDPRVKDIIYIDTGNGTGDERYGQTVIGAKRYEKVIAPPITEYFPQIMDGDKEVKEISCSRVIAEKPQSLAVNVLSATTVFLLLTSFIEYGKLPGKFLKFNANSIDISIVM